jgi:NADH-quinone oxidoreductase subunit N
VFAGVAIASMAAGNLLALRQDNVKRILAYSSIAHLGYLLVAFLATGERAATAVTFYLVAYFATSLAAFGVVAVLSAPARDADQLDDYRGLARRRRWTAVAFTISLFSLAGMPLTMGFIGKFYILTAGADSALWALVIVLVVTSTIGLYYYTRVIVGMWVEKPAEEAAGARLLPGAAGPGLASAGTAVAAPSVAGAAVPAVSGVMLAALTAFVLVFGVYPTPLIHLIERAVSTLP